MKISVNTIRVDLAPNYELIILIKEGGGCDPPPPRAQAMGFHGPEVYST